MSYISVDVEADGEIPGKYSMVCFGATIVEPSLSKTFYGKTRPISDLWIPEALSVSGFSREDHLEFDDPKEVMLEFEKWIQENSKGKPIFISDNNGFDWQWINYYFHFYLGRNIFGWSSRRLADLICGFEKNTFFKWKWMRDTEHTHNPVDDSKGNAEVLLKYKEKGLDIKLI